MAGRRTASHARTYVLASCGLGLGVGGWAIASPAMVLIGVALLAAILVDWLYLTLVDARARPIVLTRVAQPNPAPAGQTIVVQLLPPPDATPGWAADQATVSETLPPDLVPWSALTTRPRERGGLGLSYSITSPTRGQWRVGPYRLSRPSPLGLWQGRRQAGTTHRLTVWPPTVPLAAPPTAPDRAGRTARDALPQPRPDNTTVRQYAPGDDLRRIHWRSSARRGDLVSRAEEPTDSDRVWVGVVVETSADASARELAVSLAASWCQAIIRQNSPVDLACGAHLHHGDLGHLLTVLAGASQADLAQPLPATPPDGAALLVVASGPFGTAPDHLPAPPRGVGLGRQHNGAVVISADPAVAAGLAAAGWPVVQLTADVPLADAAERVNALWQARAV